MYNDLKKFANNFFDVINVSNNKFNIEIFDTFRNKNFN